MAKLSAAAFVEFLKERLAAGDGYIMGARGQDPKKWSKTSWWFTQYKGKQKTQALKWRETAERVWDCQGLVEGYINDMTGQNIDVRARNNFSSWCEPKGQGTIPAQYRVPGAAVFSGWPISHVGYLVEPVNPSDPAGDWWVIEARGVAYGVVKTRLLARSWTRWGLMTKYFEYDAAAPETAPEPGQRTLRKGMSGDDVREMQRMLIDLGYNLGKWGADGEFGSGTFEAVKAFQRANWLAVDGICGPDTWGALLDAFSHEDDSPDEEEIPRYTVDALDLSQYNTSQFGNIDWAKIKREVGFLILRAGITRESSTPLGIGADTHFKRMAAKCNEYGIPFWAYYYGRGKTIDEARKEAEYLFEIAREYKPVGYCLDCEEKGLKVGAFFARLIELGAEKTMLYIGHNWYPVYNLPTDENGFILTCDATWIPRYGKNDGTAKDKYIPKYPCDLWQYTSVYAFEGIPDKTLDANKITGQRHDMAWFRGEG